VLTDEQTDRQTRSQTAQTDIAENNTILSAWVVKNLSVSTFANFKSTISVDFRTLLIWLLSVS